LDTQTAADVAPRYKKFRKGLEILQFCTDYNLSHTAQMIRDKYTPLANAIRQH
jgi:hypothetical protein